MAWFILLYEFRAHVSCRTTDAFGCREAARYPRILHGFGQSEIAQHGSDVNSDKNIRLSWRDNRDQLPSSGDSVERYRFQIAVTDGCRKLVQVLQSLRSIESLDEA